MDYTIPSKEIFENEPCRINRLPISIYDLELGSANDPNEDILGKLAGKVTLLFNVAAGCGNIPQHAVLEELNRRFADNPDFSILAVVVDDFWCHGYPEFQDGLQNYIDGHGLSISPGQMACKYAFENYGSTYPFTSQTYGRYDKHTYDPKWVPGEKPTQEMSNFWHYLTGAYLADVNENGIPYQNEVAGWTDVKRVRPPDHKRGYAPLRGNFEKFLISRSGECFIRYGNGFLFGQRDRNNNLFPWLSISTSEDGIEDYRGGAVKSSEPNVNLESEMFSAPNFDFIEIIRFGVTHSLDLITKDINFMLSQTEL
ncbi:MAG: hypothetical protein O3A30_03905 [Bacteroidetes bacterium]|nr:hypothetical protein [Bacteroidota bacterium]